MKQIRVLFAQIDVSLILVTLFFNLNKSILCLISNKSTI